MVYSHSGGPEPRKTGGPGDSTCAQAQCHVGTPNANGNRINVTFESGSTYTPGATQRITIQITEPAALYGFQMSARPASNANSVQAGRFTAVEPGTFVLCEDGSTRSASGNCRTTAPLEFIEHNQPRSQGQYAVQWTAPDTNVGDILVFVAANAANGNGREDSGDKIYTASFTLSAGAASAPPAVSQGGVLDAFNGQAGIASSTWISIYGTNLATTTKDWSGASEFSQGQLPTQIDNVRVTVNNRPAAIHFISPGQINILGPTDDAVGDVQVVVTTPGGSSSPVTVRKSAILPSIYAPFGQASNLFATVVENSTGAILGKAGVEPRATRAVRPGDVIQIYASGLGPTNPAIAADRTVPAAAPVVNTPIVRFGQTAAEVFGAALTFPGLYQINARVPTTVPDGDIPFTVEVSGVRSPGNVFISVQR